MSWPADCISLGVGPSFLSFLLASGGIGSICEATIPGRATWNQLKLGCCPCQIQTPCANTMALFPCPAHDEALPTSICTPTITSACNRVMAGASAAHLPACQRTALTQEHAALHQQASSSTTAAPGKGALHTEDVEALRSMILSLVDEPLVLAVKLADRLHNMRTCHVLKPDRQAALATETLQVWCGLAERLGMFPLKVPACACVLSVTVSLYVRLHGMLPVQRDCTLQPRLVSGSSDRDWRD